MGYRPRGAYHHRRFRIGRVLIFALVVGLLVGGWEPMAAAVAIGFPMMAMVVVLAGVISLVRLARAAGRRQFWQAPAPRFSAPVPVPVPRPTPDWRADWLAAHERFAALRGEYGGYECDPLAVLRLPALADVTVASTARFVDAFAEAQALDTDALPPAQHATSFRHAVEHAIRAWQAARDAAERIQLAGLTPEERSSVQRVIKLLTVAKESGNDAERLAAYAKAREELARLERTGRIHLPKAAMAALSASARTGLPGGLTVPADPAPVPDARPA
jgi:hypothetical protein